MKIYASVLHFPELIVVDFEPVDDYGVPDDAYELIFSGTPDEIYSSACDDYKRLSYLSYLYGYIPERHRLITIAAWSADLAKEASNGNLRHS